MTTRPRATAVEIGYTLSSEERQPEELVRLAQQAEDAGFPYAVISDHFHPWTDTQGSAPFAWSVLGGVAAATRRLRAGTGVTCPIVRYHPAVVAQAAATIGCLMPGRFFLGVGSGESLNEHITGNAWPPPDLRQDMLEEAVGVIRMLHEAASEATTAVSSRSRTRASTTFRTSRCRSTSPPRGSAPPSWPDGSATA